MGETIEADSWEAAEKFAELIVKECLSIVDDAERGGNNETWDNAVKFIRRDLKEHFGIEEYFNRVLQKQVETTGIDYYCGCCGKPHYVGKDIEHDKECIWY